MVFYIQDAIYGLIEFNEIEEAFIDSPEFQRLRRIKQTGCCQFVFPSAVHTRFEHSLGVAHLSGIFYKQAIKNHNTSYPDEQLTEEYLQVIRIGGLLHDIGHCAYSHIFEKALAYDKNKFSHEEFSVKLVRRINTRLKLLTPADEALVNAIISGKPLPDYPPYLFEIVANKKSGLDSDKQDYIRRDAYMIGMQPFSSDYIIKHTSINANGHICFPIKVYDEIKRLFEMRKLMFARVYYHTKVVEFDKKMICAIQNVIRYLTITTRKSYDDIDFLLSLTDGFLEYHIKYSLNINIDMREAHSCDNCEHITLHREPQLSGDVAGDPMPYVIFDDRK